MIKGKLNDQKVYEDIKIQKAIKWLEENKNLDIGVYEIDNKDIYAIVQTYNTKSASALKWEAHKKYIDIQVIEKGIENIGISDIDAMSKSEDYQEENDIQFFEGKGKFYELKAGEYMIIYPKDLHMPTVGDGQSVKKIVVKVRV